MTVTIPTNLHIADGVSSFEYEDGQDLRALVMQYANLNDKDIDALNAANTNGTLTDQLTKLGFTITEETE